MACAEHGLLKASKRGGRGTGSTGKCDHGKRGLRTWYIDLAAARHIGTTPPVAWRYLGRTTTPPLARSPASAGTTMYGACLPLTISG
jgi:hypothetical protein